MTDDTNREDVRSLEQVRLQKLEERMADMVHVADLRELVNNWRAEAKRTSERLETRAEEGQDVDYDDAKDRNLRKCARQLEELIEDRCVETDTDHERQSNSTEEPER